MVANHDKTLYGWDTALWRRVCRTHQTHELRLKNLRSLVDDGERKMFYREKMRIGIHRRCSGTHHSHLADIPSYLLSLFHALDSVGEQIFVKTLLTHRCLSYAQKVYPLLVELAANLVYGTVRVREQQYRPLTEQLLLELA